MRTTGTATDADGDRQRAAFIHHTVAQRDLQHMMAKSNSSALVSAIANRIEYVRPSSLRPSREYTATISSTP